MATRCRYAYSEPAVRAWFRYVQPESGRVHRGTDLSRGGEHPHARGTYRRRPVRAWRGVGVAAGRRRLRRRQRGDRRGAGSASAGAHGGTPRPAEGPFAIRARGNPARALGPVGGDGCRPVTSAGTDRRPADRAGRRLRHRGRQPLRPGRPFRSHLEPVALSQLAAGDAAGAAAGRVLGSHVRVLRHRSPHATRSAWSCWYAAGCGSARWPSTSTAWRVLSPSGRR